MSNHAYTMHPCHIGGQSSGLVRTDNLGRHAKQVGQMIHQTLRGQRSRTSCGWTEVEGDSTALALHATPIPLNPITVVALMCSPMFPRMAVSAQWHSSVQDRLSSQISAANREENLQLRTWTCCTAWANISGDWRLCYNWACKPCRAEFAAKDLLRHLACAWQADPPMYAKNCASQPLTLLRIGRPVEPKHGMTRRFSFLLLRLPAGLSSQT